MHNYVSVMQVRAVTLAKGEIQRHHESLSVMPTARGLLSWHWSMADRWMMSPESKKLRHCKTWLMMPVAGGLLS